MSKKSKKSCVCVPHARSASVSRMHFIYLGMQCLVIEGMQVGKRAKGVLTPSHLILYTFFFWMSHSILYISKLSQNSQVL